MKLVTYESSAGPRVGELAGERAVVDLGFDGTMIEFIEADTPIGNRTEVGEARLLAPLKPRSMRDFLTFKGHLDNAFARLGRDIPEEWFTVPAFYKGMPDTVIGPEETIPWPAYTDRLDHELELACVIGKKGKDIDPADALDHVFGWTIWNDMSARDVQTRELPLALGPSKAKDWDGANVIGPCIVTADGLDGTRAEMSVRVDGHLWGQDNSANMQHGFPDLIAYASQAQTLYPGELLGSGTAANGSGIEQDRWLRPGSTIEMSVEGIGTLRNRIGNKEE